jgi:hydroxymethylglutaryl-CoA reductase (NADPH)
MIASSLLPSRFRGEQAANGQPVPPSRVNKKITPLLQLVSKIACLHPIYTICVIAILASTTYVGVVKESLVDATRSVRRAEWDSLVEGSRSLIVGPETAWKWQGFDADAPIPNDVDHLALLTLVFPESTPEAPQTAPLPHIVPLPNNLSVVHLPSTSNPLSAYSQDSALAFAVKYTEAPEFLGAAQEIPNDVPGQEFLETGSGQREQKMWIMKAAKVQTRSSVIRWVQNAWSEFLDLLKNAETLDIIIMVLGYLAMHLTFVSLFLSMRKMGSNVWLATSVLFSSTFAFLFGLNVTTKLGVPVSVILLSEGLPFLVVTIGFEKNIVLTKAVLSHALDHRRPEESFSGRRSPSPQISLSQYAVQKAIKDCGFEIVRDYVLEILILIAGAASGVQGGLQQFCFLAAWILFFDCALLFTFYTAILCIKLEINRIKRHVEMRKALEDDGLSRRVAENVARSNERKDGKAAPLFGQDFKSSSVPRFKFWMVVGFFAVNIANLCTIPFRTPGTLSTISSLAGSFGGLGGFVTAPPVDPFKVAASGLDEIAYLARGHDRTTVVTVLTPIKYELEFPSIHYAVPPKSGENHNDSQGQFGDYGMGGQMVGSILTSLEDPILSKWIVVALAMSVALNGYLFNVARLGIKDPNVPDHPVDPQALAAAERFNDPQSATLPALGRELNASQAKLHTPAATDDEADSLLMKKSKPIPLERPTPRIPTVSRSQAELDKLLAEKRIYDMTDDEVVALSLKGKIPGYALERSLKDCTRAVKIRRSIIARTKATADLTAVLERSKLPYENYNWDLVLGACCENVIGYMPLPVGVAGPLVVDGQSYFIPMATTEGVLVASASRGCKAINAGGGAVTVLTADGMTRGPCVSFETLERAGAAKLWIDSETGQTMMKNAFNSTSRFARLQTMKTALAGTNLYIRFKTTTGDAMGMNMISKGVEHALSVMASEGGFEDMQIVTVSGNYCTDKKAAAINWVDGRGKGIVAEAIIPADVVKAVLKTDVDTLVDMNTSKNLIGSAMAASVGGFNAHAANMVAAIFIATGQDPAQVVESANCITIMKKCVASLTPFHGQRKANMLQSPWLSANLGFHALY